VCVCVGVGVCVYICVCVGVGVCVFISIYLSIGLGDEHGRPVGTTKPGYTRINAPFRTPTSLSIYIDR